MKLHSSLGPGYSESVYKNALVLDVRDAGFSVEVEKRRAVNYRGRVVGDVVADLVINSALIVELKAVAKLVAAHEVQLVNYLTTTGITEGLLLNFGTERLELKKKYRAQR